MKKLYPLKFIFIVFAIFIVYSCNNDEGDYNNETQTEYLVSQNTIVEIANGLMFESTSSARRAGTPESVSSFAKKTLGEVVPVKGNDNLPVCYVVNYDGGGFLILAADSRVEPVLAFSDEGRFSIEEIKELGGITDWVEDVAQEVNHLRINKVEPSAIVAEMWKQERIQSILTPSKTAEAQRAAIGGGDDMEEGPFPPCQGYYIEQLPLLQTIWDQTLGYNNRCPLHPLYPMIVCDEDRNGGKTLAGCVAVAMAQLMCYHQYPAGYNYSIMPPFYTREGGNPTGIDEMARLIADAAYSVDAAWGCDATNADIADVPGALVNKFGYLSATISDFNVDRVVGSLQSRRPVLLRGEEKEHFIIFPYAGKGHVWVCDGFKRQLICYEDPSNTIGEGYMYTYLYMNWGWRGLCNGWYSSYFSPSDGDSYSEKQKMVIVRPN